ncbi:hypothetical protein Tco_0809151 [Tanacetum coccineum]
MSRYPRHPFALCWSGTDLEIYPTSNVLGTGSFANSKARRLDAPYPKPRGSSIVISLTGNVCCCCSDATSSPSELRPSSSSSLLPHPTPSASNSSSLVLVSNIELEVPRYLFRIGREGDDVGDGDEEGLGDKGVVLGNSGWVSSVSIGSLRDSDSVSVATGVIVSGTVWADGENMTCDNILYRVDGGDFVKNCGPVWGCDRLVIRAKVIENQIMAASAIAISSDSSDEKTSTTAPVISSATPVVETTLVASPTGLCGLIPYSDSNSDSPDEMVSAHPSSSSEFSIAPVTAPPGIRRWSAILIRPEEAIPFGRPYRTHLNGSHKLLTARKRVGPLPARILAWWCVSPRSSDHHPSSSSSSSDSLPVYSSVRGSLAPTRVDLLPPHKRFRDLYSFEASIEEDTKIDPIETEVDMELGISDGDDVKGHVKIDPRDVRDDIEEYEADTSAGDTVEVCIDPMSAPIVEEEIVEPAGEDSSDLSGTRDSIVRSLEDMPIDLDDVRRLEADQLIARGQRVSMIERIDSLRLENLKVRAILDIERDRMNSLRLRMSLSQEEFSQRHARIIRDLELGNGNDNGGGDGNGNGNGNEDFMKCQPLSFKGTEGVVGLIRWSEKMETVFHISNYPERYQVNYW